MSDEDRIKIALNDSRILGLNAADNDALGELFTEFFSSDNHGDASCSDSHDSVSASDRESSDSDSDAGGRGKESASDGENGIDNAEEPMDVDDNDDLEPIVVENVAANIIQDIGRGLSNGFFNNKISTLFVMLFFTFCKVKEKVRQILIQLSSLEFKKLGTSARSTNIFFVFPELCTFNAEESVLILHTQTSLSLLN